MRQAERWNSNLSYLMKLLTYCSNYLELKRFVFIMNSWTDSNILMFESFERFGLPISRNLRATLNVNLTLRVKDHFLQYFRRDILKKK